VASVCIHHGEEPAISGPEGICNVFFTNCNLQCIYCQNHQISNNLLSNEGYGLPLNSVVSRITSLLDRGIKRVGFVSPSHVIQQVKSIIATVESQGYKPIWIYNSNGYDKPETLRTLEGIIDVYLPDFKYSEPETAHRYSGARDYPDFARRAIQEMFRQKGSVLLKADDGTAESGIIVRHLVLPGHVENSIGVLRFLAGEISPRIHVSLMAQYYPTENVMAHPQLGRRITEEEYMQVVAEMEQLGMYNGWVQEFDSSEFYRPDFNKEHPFE
jgi:putative pyruvate formate lyase activating enzyme